MGEGFQEGGCECSGEGEGGKGGVPYKGALTDQREGADKRARGRQPSLEEGPEEKLPNPVSELRPLSTARHSTVATTMATPSVATRRHLCTQQGPSTISTPITTPPEQNSWKMPSNKPAELPEKTGKSRSSSRAPQARQEVYISAGSEMSPREDTLTTCAPLF